MAFWRCAPLVLGAFVACGDNRHLAIDGGAGSAGDSGGVADAAIDAPEDAIADAPPDAAPFCGDGKLDPGEECDQPIRGLSGDGCSSTCTLEAITWLNYTPSTAPFRTFHAMAFDHVRNHLVMFGGYGLTAGPPTDETWEWDGNAWTQRVTLVSPPPRSHHAMVFDSYRQRIVMFGGENGSVFLNDTWEWDGTTWTERTPTISPPAQLFPFM